MLDKIAFKINEHYILREADSILLKIQEGYKQ